MRPLSKVNDSLLNAAWCRIKPVDEEGKSRSPEKMSELVHEAHQANTKKALKALKVHAPALL